jgi:hypothetical protein
VQAQISGAHARASSLSPCCALRSPAPRYTLTQSRPNDHPLRHQVTRCPPGLTWLGLPVRSDGLRVHVKRSAVSTTEVGEEPSSLSPPHAPTHMHVSPRTTLSPAPACVRERNSIPPPEFKRPDKKHGMDLLATTRPPVPRTLAQPKRTTGPSEFWALSSGQLDTRSALSTR